MSNKINIAFISILMCVTNLLTVNIIKAEDCSQSIRMNGYIYNNHNMTPISNVIVIGFYDDSETACYQLDHKTKRKEHINQNIVIQSCMNSKIVSMSDNSGAYNIVICCNVTNNYDTDLSEKSPDNEKEYYQGKPAIVDIIYFKEGYLPQRQLFNLERNAHKLEAGDKGKWIYDVGSIYMVKLPNAKRLK